MAQPPHPTNSDGSNPPPSSAPSTLGSSDLMDIDDDDDFFNGPDADDFGSDYEDAAQDVDSDFQTVASHPQPQSHQDKPPAYSFRQSDDEDLELARALQASLTSPALETGRATTSQSTSAAVRRGNGTSTASVQAAQYEKGRELTWSDPPRGNGSAAFFDDQLPQYSRIGSSGPPPRPSPSTRPPKLMCIVCQERPAFNNGYRSFPTCGNTCGRLLEEAQKGAPRGKLPANSNHGRMGNPQNSRGGGASSSSNRGGGGGGGGGGFLSRGSGSSASPIKMCKVCNLRPIYQKGGKVYPTCGLTCAAKLQPPGSVPMCDYCHERPKVVINDKIFPHCGKTCRDKARPPGAPGGAHYYTTRAFSSNANSNSFSFWSPSGASNSNHPYSNANHANHNSSSPNRNHTNRDFTPASAAARKAATTNRAACTTCIQCWSAPRMSQKNDFCSDLCADIAGQLAPLLLEIPRGHASFQGVEQHCIDSWKTKTSSYPVIKRLYMVQPHMQFDAAHKEYQVNVSSPVGSASEKAGNQVQHWISPTRQCALGDAGYTKPCDSTKCMLCSLVRTAPKTGSYARGVITDVDLERAVNRTMKQSKGHGNIVLLSQVILGKSCESTKDNIGPLPSGTHSIRLVEYSMYGFGSAQWTGETLVFDGRAIKPLYLIVFE